MEDEPGSAMPPAPERSGSRTGKNIFTGTRPAIRQTFSLASLRQQRIFACGDLDLAPNRQFYPPAGAGNSAPINVSGAWTTAPGLRVPISKPEGRRVENRVAAWIAIRTWPSQPALPADISA